MSVHCVQSLPPEVKDQFHYKRHTPQPLRSLQERQVPRGTPILFKAARSCSFTGDDALTSLTPLCKTTDSETMRKQALSREAVSTMASVYRSRWSLHGASMRPSASPPSAVSCPRQCVHTTLPARPPAAPLPSTPGECRVPEQRLLPSDFNTFS